MARERVGTVADRGLVHRGKTAADLLAEDATKIVVAARSSDDGIVKARPPLADSLVDLEDRLESVEKTLQVVLDRLNGTTPEEEATRRGPVAEGIFATVDRLFRRIGEVETLVETLSKAL